MIHRSLSTLFALLLSAPALAASEPAAAPAAVPEPAPQVLFNFVRPTDVVKVQTNDAFFPELTAESTPEGEILRRLVFNPAPKPSLILTPQQGTWDWSQVRAMSLRLQSAMDWALTVDVRIESADGKALTTRIALPAGPAQTLLVPLQATSPRAQGMRAGVPMPWMRGDQKILLADTVEGELNPAQVSSVTVSLSNPDVAQNVLLGRFGVRGDQDFREAYQGIVDGFGQYTRGNWPEKVKSDEQLRAAAAKEAEQLKKWQQQLPEQDRYGGWLRGPSFPAKGFFNTVKQDDRWYLVTPDGHPYFSLGVNAVTQQQSQTYIEGRERMFSDLPAADGPLAPFYGKGDNRSDTGANKGRAYASGRWFDFYNANLERQYGELPCAGSSECVGCTPAALSADSSAPAPKPEVVAPGSQTQLATPASAAAAVATAGAPKSAAEPPTAEECDRLKRAAATERWASRSIDRLKAWGFNTIGNWSDAELGEAKRMPYTVPLSISGDYATISTGHDWWGGIPDPFDPRFAMAAERAIAIAARGHRDDPWLIGYFADNELSWAAPGNEPHDRYAIAYGTLRLTTDVPAKRAFLKQLRDKYRNEQGLSKAWGIDLEHWELMEDPGFEAPLPNPEHPAIEEDLQYFQRVFAETYFKTISDSLDWHAPNHLLLGGRFAISTPEAVAACAKYCDVLSFNFYTREPQHGYDFEALRKLDKPVMVTEFHFGSRDRGPFWGGVAEVYKEEERGPAYANFITRALAEPTIVGAHWFQYVDQPVTGRLLDGENGHLGLVGITDLPYQGFVEAVRKANLAVPEKWLPAAEKAAKVP